MRAERRSREDRSETQLASELENILFEEYSSLTTIGDSSFCVCTNIKYVSFKNQINLKIIPSSAFGECSNLERITFCGCIKLNSISIPSTIQYIDDYRFYNCSKLETVSFE